MNYYSKYKTNQFVFDNTLLFSKMVHKNIIQYNKVCKLHKINVKIPKLQLDSVVNLHLLN